MWVRKISTSRRLSCLRLIDWKSEFKGRIEREGVFSGDNSVLKFEVLMGQLYALLMIQNMEVEFIEMDREGRKGQILGLCTQSW